jgi:hypothetical protein
LTVAAFSRNPLVPRSREALVAEVSTPHDDGQMAFWDGPRLAGCTTTTTLGLGYDACTFGLLTVGGAELWPLEMALGVLRLCAQEPILRLSANGTLVWCGRLRDCTLGPIQEHPHLGLVTPVSVAAKGFAWTEYRRKAPVLGDEFTEETAAPSLSELVKVVTEQFWEDGISRIEPVWTYLEDTATNLGPIIPQVQENAFDLFVNALRVSDEQGDEFALVVYAPEDGPRIIRLDDTGLRTQPRWSTSIVGASIQLAGDEYASEVRTVFSNNDGESEATMTQPLPNYLLSRHGDLPRTLTLSLPRMKLAAAEQAQLGTLLLKGWPVAVTGPLTIGPQPGAALAQLRTIEGGWASAYLARAGDVVELHDAPPQPERERTLALIESTSFNWDSGELTLGFDERRITSRPGEDQGAIAALRRVLEPGQQFTFNRSWHSSVAQTINSENERFDYPEIRFTLPAAITATVTVKIQGSPNLDGIDQRFYHGFSIDNDDWDKDDFTRSARWRTTNGEGGSQVESPVFGGVEFSAGAHQVYVRADDNAAAIGEFAVTAVTVTIVAEVPRVTHQQVANLSGQV